MNRILLLFFICFFGFSFSDAQTYIKDKQEVYGTWTRGGSPYIVQGEAIVPKGRTLRIEPGVVVKFKTGLITQYDNKDFDVAFLQIKGELVAQGTSNNFIRFTRLGDSGSWGSVILDNISKKYILKYCIFEYGSRIRNLHSDYKFKDSFGVLSIHHSIGQIKNCVFSHNSGWVLFSQESTIEINYCSFNNKSYVTVYNLNSNIDILNSILSGSTKAARNVGNSMSVKYCLVDGLIDDNINTESNVIDKNPAFQNIEETDFRLKSNSPCIGAGENGTDIGAIPYNKPKPESFDFTTTQKSPDQTAPQITINSPRNNLRTQYSNITLHGKATDESRISQVLVNNSLADLQSNGEFSARVDLPNIGSNRITVKATDQYWNTSTEILTVFREKSKSNTKNASLWSSEWRIMRMMMPI